ncbi:hypothetical protein [Geodermatophilus sp. SYSU D01176]
MRPTPGLAGGTADPSTGVTSPYGTGLDSSSVFPRFNRVQASLVVGTLALVFILVGRLVSDLLASVNAFIGAIVICTPPGWCS